MERGAKGRATEPFITRDKTISVLVSQDGLKVDFRWLSVAFQSCDYPIVIVHELDKPQHVLEGFITALLCAMQLHCNAQWSRSAFHDKNSCNSADGFGMKLIAEQKHLCVEASQDML